MSSTAYQALLDHARRISTASAVASLLEWDQETFMPPRAAKDRAEQIALVAGLAHEKLISDESGRLLERATREQNDDADAAVVLREFQREHARAVKLPTRLVEQIAKAATLARGDWIRARRESNFALFAPHLARLLELKREAADLWGWQGERYNALLDEYEPGALAADVQAVFDVLRRELVPLLGAIVAAPRQPDLRVLTRRCPISAQETFLRLLAQALGFDFQAGRLDSSVHPFCGGHGPSDVRMTVRYNESYLPESLFGLLHETGHALYEQGLDERYSGTPLAHAISLGIHESQSRMWENMIGRSRPFWEHFFGPLRAAFPSMNDVTLDAWHFAINAVQPSFIRVEADEVTYGLHIILRFGLERRLIDGTLAVQDVPAAWNAEFKALLGIDPPDDARGCLQDVHWSHGTFGYFPTYTLGNLYAAQFFETAQRELPELWSCVGRGDVAPLRDWLRAKIHRQGMRHRASELVRIVTGQALSPTPYLSYLKDKFGGLYGL